MYIYMLTPTLHWERIKFFFLLFLNSLLKSALNTHPNTMYWRPKKFQHLACSRFLTRSLHAVYLHVMQVQVAASQVIAVHLLDTMLLYMLHCFLLCKRNYKFCNSLDCKEGGNNSTNYCIHFIAFNCIITFGNFGKFHLTSSNGQNWWFSSTASVTNVGI